jgi:hypothetical protein
MKKSIMLIALLLAAAVIYAQEIPAKSVPLKVQAKVKDVFPEVATGKFPVKWEKDGANFKARVHEGSSFPALMVIDTMLNIVLVEKKVGVESLKPKALEFLKSKYKDYEISEVYQVSTKKYVVYRAKIIVKPVYIFDTDGQVVNPTDEKFPK